MEYISLTDIRLVEKSEAEMNSDLTTIFRQDYPTFVKWLGKFASDSKFRAFIKNGDIQKSSVRRVVIPVSKLIPTQNEVALDKSLNYPLSKPEIATKLLSTPVVMVASPIITFNGKYIIDGHHRWSQLYAIHPDAKIVAFDFTNPNISKPSDALKLIQLAIVSAGASKIPTANADGKNLFVVDKNTLKQYVIEHISDGSLQAFKDTGKIANVDKKEAAKYIWNNIRAMRHTSQPIPNAPKRNIMPQADAAPGGQIATIDRLKGGIKTPSNASVTETLLRIEQIINEINSDIPNDVKDAFNSAISGMDMSMLYTPPEDINHGGCGAVAKLLYYAIKKNFDVEPEILVLVGPSFMRVLFGATSDDPKKQAKIDKIQIAALDLDSMTQSKELNESGYSLYHVILKVADNYIDSNGMTPDYDPRDWGAIAFKPIKIKTLNRWLSNSDNWNDSFSRIDIPNLAKFVDNMMNKLKNKID